MYRFIAIFSISLLLFTSCREDRPEYGFVRLVFQHQWDGQPFELHRAEPYINAAGNSLIFHRLQYIISNLELDGEERIRIQSPEVHFISGDTTILITYQIPVGDYSLVSFIFGLDEDRNQPNMFPNLTPLMRWPGHTMGGGGGEGYHYMMLDGHWTSSAVTQSSPFGLHLGALEELIGTSETVVEWGVGPYPDFEPYPSRIRIDSVFARYHHYLEVRIPRIFTVEPNTITTLEPIVMNIRQWMEAPLTWDFDETGGSMMWRRDALDSLATNGAMGVFVGADVRRGRMEPVLRTFSVFR